MGDSEHHEEQVDGQKLENEPDGDGDLEDDCEPTEIEEIHTKDAEKEEREEHFDAFSIVILLKYFLMDL